MAIQRNVQCVSYKSGEATIAQFVPVKLGTNAEEVVLCTALTDIVKGFTQIDSTYTGQEMSIATNKGATVFAYVGAGGWTKGTKLGLDGANYNRLITYNSATHDMVVAIAEETNATVGALGEVTLVLDVKTA